MRLILKSAFPTPFFSPPAFQQWQRWKSFLKQWSSFINMLLTTEASSKPLRWLRFPVLLPPCHLTSISWSWGISSSWLLSDLKNLIKMGTILYPLRELDKPPYMGKYSAYIYQLTCKLLWVIQKLWKCLHKYRLSSAFSYSGAFRQIFI